MRWLAIIVVVVACEKTDTPPDPPPPDPLHGIELPEVAGAGYVAGKADPSIVVTTRAFVIDGMSIVGVTNGDVPADEKEGGALGIKIPRLSRMGGRLMANHVATPLVIAFDRHLTYHLLVEALFSLKQKESGWKDFRILAKAKGTTVMVPISLPDKAPSSSSATALLLRPDDPSLTPDVVLAKIHGAYMPDLKRCYTAQLKVDPATHGKLQLGFTVTPTGAVTNPRVAGLGAPSLDTCVRTAMTRWRFPIPKARSGEATDASFQISLVLDNEDGNRPSSASVPPPPRPPVAIEAVDPPPPPPSSSEEPIKMIVSITRDKLLVWSISGLEGTLSAPKATLAPTEISKLPAILGEIVHRRWPQQRPDDSRTIIVMADGHTSMQTVAELFGAVRAAPDGSVLFPEILLSSGFE